MKENEITSDWIDRYNHDELDNAGRSLFEEQMKSNPLLRAEVSTDASLDRFLRDGAVIDLMHKVGAVAARQVKKERRMNGLMMAAALLCLVMIGGLLYHMQKKTVFNEPAAVPDISGITGITADDPAVHEELRPSFVTPPVRISVDSFKPLDEFELLTGSVSRSFLLEMISPPANSIYTRGNEVPFIWSGGDTIIPVSVVIMDNLGIPVFGTRVQGSGMFRLKTNGWHSGLYYYKVMVDEELVLMGKFMIVTTRKD